MLYLLILILFVLLLVYISKTSTLERRMNGLVHDFLALRSRLEDRGPQEAQPPSPPAPTKAATPVPASPPPPQPSAVTTRPMTPLPSPPTHPRQPSRTREEWEALIGGKLMNRIGALALILGVGFFLKYAFDNDWITETTRVLIGVATGAGLLVVADRTQRKGYKVFSHGLVGAGLSVLYLSVYASFNFYALVPQPLAFVLMGAVTVLSFLEAHRYDSLAVALLGWAGGFLTPFMLSSGESNAMGLFTYVALLDAGILAVALMKERWLVLQPLTLVGTYVVYLDWYSRFYTPDDLLITVYCLTVFWVLFHAVDVMRIFLSVGSRPRIRELLSATNIVLFYPCLFAVVHPENRDAMTGATLGLGIVYFVTAQIARMKARERDAGFARPVLTAMVLLAIATGIQFSGFTTVIWWAAEGAILVWCGVKWRMRFVWLGAAGLLAVAAIKLLFTPDAFGHQPLLTASVLLNQRALTYLVLAAASWWGAALLSGLSERPSPVISSGLYYLGSLLLFGVITVETIASYEVRIMDAPDPLRTSLWFTRSMALAVLWTACALALLAAGRWRNIPPLVFSALGILGCSVMAAGFRGSSFVPVEEFSLVWNVRFSALASVLAGMLLSVRLLRPGSRTSLFAPNPAHRDALPEIVRILQIGFVLLLLVLLTGETRDLFQKQMALIPPDVDPAAERRRLSNLEQLSLSGVWLVYTIVLMAAGIWKRSRGLRILSIVFFGVTILKIFTYDLSFLDTLYRIFSFVGLGLILLAVSYLYQKYKSVIFEQSSDVP